MFTGTLHKALADIMMSSTRDFTRIGKNVFSYERSPGRIEKYVIAEDGAPLPDIPETITRIMVGEQVIEEYRGVLYRVIRIW